jgi:NitT/TauT family transport system permease protein
MLALTGAVVAEFVASQEGLGHYITYEGGLANPAASTAGILFLVVMGLILYFIVDGVERILIPWHPSRRNAGAGAG